MLEKEEEEERVVEEEEERVVEEEEEGAKRTGYYESCSNRVSIVREMKVVACIFFSKPNLTLDLELNLCMCTSIYLGKPLCVHLYCLPSVYSS